MLKTNYSMKIVLKIEIHTVLYIFYAIQKPMHSRNQKMEYKLNNKINILQEKQTYRV